MKIKLSMALVALAMIAAIPTASASQAEENNRACGYADAISGCIVWVDSLGGYEGEFLPGGIAKCVQLNDSVRACWATHKKVTHESCDFNEDNDIVCAYTSSLVPVNMPAPPDIADLDDPSCFPIEDTGFYCMTMTEDSEEVTLHANVPTAVAVPAPVPVFTG